MEMGCENMSWGPESYLKACFVISIVEPLFVISIGEPLFVISIVKPLDSATRNTLSSLTELSFCL
jgi:hypothetical protein